MTHDENLAIYDKIVTAEASGDYAAASAYSNKLKDFNE